MNRLFYVGCVLVMVFVGVCSYWYMNPHRAPSWLRGTLPGWDLRSPQSPVSGFRAPQF
jgi:hypothetical protein